MITTNKLKQDLSRIIKTLIICVSMVLYIFFIFAQMFIKNSRYLQIKSASEMTNNEKLHCIRLWKKKISYEESDVQSIHTVLSYEKLKTFSKTKGLNCFTLQFGAW